MLGKFVADRQYRIRQLEEAEHVLLIKELQTVRKQIETTSKDVSNYSPKQSHPKYNRKLWEEVAHCAHNGIEEHFNVPYDVFVEKLVNNELNSVVTCFQSLKKLIKSIELEDT